MTTLSVVFAPTKAGAHNYNLIIETGTEKTKIALKGICLDNFRKTLRPFKNQLIPEYISFQHPKYVEFLDEFFQFLEEKNYISYLSDNESEWSLYQNIVNLMLFGDIESFPIEHIRLFEAYFNDYANTYNFTDLVVDIDDEALRKLATNATDMNRLKCSWSVYNFYVAAVSDYTVSDVEKEVTLDAYYTTTTEVTAPPDHAAMSDDLIVLSEIPVYRYNDGTGLIERNATIIASPNDYKGTDPFHYQVISKSDIMTTGGFVGNMITNCNPAGFDAEIIYTPVSKTLTLKTYSMTFPKRLVYLTSVPVP